VNMAQVLVAIESKQRANGHNWTQIGTNGSDWKQTGPFGHKLKSVLIQLSSNDVKHPKFDLIWEMKGYGFNYFMRVPIKWVRFKALLLDITLVGMKDYKNAKFSSCC
jgi:hypothetical protein